VVVALDASLLEAVMPDVAPASDAVEDVDAGSCVVPDAADASDPVVDAGASVAAAVELLSTTFLLSLLSGVGASAPPVSDRSPV
jgi:hypothetical protein